MGSEMCIRDRRLAKEFGDKPGGIPAGATDWPSQAAVKVTRSASDAAASVRLRESVSQAAKTAAEGLVAT